MKTPAFLQNKFFIYTSAALALTLASVAGWTVGEPIYREYQDSFAAKEFKQYGVIGTYQKHFFDFAVHLRNLAGLEKTNEELEMRLAELDKKTTLLESSQAERSIASDNEHSEAILKETAGSSAATLEKNLAYTVPERLNLNQLYSLALGYFRKQEFDKSAVILGHLLTQVDDPNFDKAENHLMAGISNFKLKNFVDAQKWIDQSVKRSSAQLPVHRQALVWQILVYQSQGKSKLAQAALLSFVGQYPHSDETRQLNSARTPARAENREVPTVHLNPYDAVIADAKAREAKKAPEKKEDAHE